MIRRALLVCGILSSLLYVAMTVFIAMRWENYDSASQTISELSAVGAPTRSLWAGAGAVYTVLVIAFGWGVWMSGVEYALCARRVCASSPTAALAFCGRSRPCTCVRCSQWAAAPSVTRCTSLWPARLCC